MARHLVDPTVQYLSTGQVAGLLGCNPKTVTRMFESGDLDGFALPSGHLRILLSSVQALMRSTPTDGDVA